MRAGWANTLLIVVVLAAGLTSRPVTAQESRDRRRSDDDSRDRRRSSDDSRDRRSTAEDPRSRGAAGFDVFQILQERNIFDPQRRPMVRSDAPPPPSPAAPIAESFALQGVLLDTGEAVAFFEGSSPEFNAAVNLGGIIGGHKLVEIRTDRVMLASPARKMELPVAWQMSRRAGGEWEATTATTQLASSAPPLPTLPSAPPGSGPPGSMTISPGGPAPAPGSPAPAGGSADDMLRRLMERRRKEMGQ